MIHIRKSETADTRTCDFANTSKETLLASSRQHIGDVVKALAFFSGKITEAAGEHDYDKFTAIDWFHADFLTGFKQTGWWDNHRKIHRHHLDKADGVPDDVNLIDVIEHIADCVMAGMARSGSVYELKLSDELLQLAFRNTTNLLKSNVEVDQFTAGTMEANPHSVTPVRRLVNHQVAHGSLRSSPSETMDSPTNGGLTTPSSTTNTPPSKVDTCSQCCSPT